MPRAKLNSDRRFFNSTKTVPRYLFITLVLILILNQVVGAKPNNNNNNNLKTLQNNPSPTLAKRNNLNHHRHHHHLQQRLLVISLGGFRHDYITSYNLQNLNKLLHKSARAPYLNPQFTTQSFPNHWSMATGSYVETHGIVANKFYDPRFREYFIQTKPMTDIKWWNQSGITPVWHTSVKHGLKTAVLNWPGCDAYFAEDADLYSKSPYSETSAMTLNAKLTESVKMMSEDDYKLIMIYHNQPDSIAHKYGINSAELNVTLIQLDDSIGQLIEQLKQVGMWGSSTFNLVVVSDHGMSEIRKNIVVNDYFDEHDAQIWSFNRNLIHLKPLISVEILIKKLSRMPDITINLKENMPERLHYRNNNRIGEIILSAIEGVGFIYVSKEPLQFNGKLLQKPLNYEQKKKLFTAIADKASHGYDWVYPNMKGIFLAYGAMFKKNFTSENAIENVDVHPLVCNVLSLHCDFSRNGSFENIRPFFRADSRQLIQYKRLFAQSVAAKIRTRSCWLLNLFTLLIIRSFLNSYLFI